MIEKLDALPVNFQAFPQKATTWFGLQFDPFWGLDLDDPVNTESKAEVFQLTRFRNRKHITYIGLSLESSKVKNLNDYIAWINKIHYLNKTAHFYISTDCPLLFLELLNFLKWENPQTCVRDFFVERNTYYPLAPKLRWAADVNLLAQSKYIIATPDNFKAAVASEMSGIPVLSDIPQDVYVANLEGQKVL